MSYQPKTGAGRPSVIERLAGLAVVIAALAAFGALLTVPHPLTVLITELLRSGR